MPPDAKGVTPPPLHWQDCTGRRRTDRRRLQGSVEGGCEDRLTRQPAIAGRRKICARRLLAARKASRMVRRIAAQPVETGEIAAQLSVESSSASVGLRASISLDRGNASSSASSAVRSRRAAGAWQRPTARPRARAASWPRNRRAAGAGGRDRLHHTAPGKAAAVTRVPTPVRKSQSEAHDDRDETRRRRRRYAGVRPRRRSTSLPPPRRPAPKHADGVAGTDAP